MDQRLPVAIIGGGPVGLAAAAQLALKNEPFILFEGGATVGANVMQWKHVRLFSPWKYNIDRAAEQLLLRHGWEKPGEDMLHTGEELVTQYLIPLAQLPEISPHLYLNSKVKAVGRKGLDKVKTSNREKLPFVVHYEQKGRVKTVEARAVIDASGTWHKPNPIGSGGIWANGEEEANQQIFYGIPDVTGEHRTRYENKTVLVVGSGHSAINALLELAELAAEAPETRIIWALRKQSVQEAYGGGTDDALPARGELGLRIKRLVDDGLVRVVTPFFISDIEQDGGRLNVIGKLHEEDITLKGVDEIVTNTGSRPDLSFLREVRVDVDAALECVPALAELIDPNIHSCGTVRPHGEQELRQKEQNFYIVGTKSYGRAPTFLMATGYEQVRSIVAALTGDMEAARRVELNLPETGVCKTNAGVKTNDTPGVVAADSACCAPAQKEKQTVTVASNAPCCG